MPVESLVALARKACIRNITAIIDVGDAPYELVRPILMKVPNAEQLHQLETNCPHLVGETAEIWRNLIRKDIQSYAHEDPPEPKEPGDWYKLYRKLRRREQKEIERQEELLVGQLQGLKDSAAERTSKVVDASSLPRLRRALGGRVEKRPSTTAQRTADASRLRFTSGSRTKAVSGQDVLNKARREARELSHFSLRGTTALSKPSHLGPSRSNVPTVAPKSLVSEYQRPKGYADGQMPAGSISVPRRTSVFASRASAISTNKREVPMRKGSVTSPTSSPSKPSMTSRKDDPNTPTERHHLLGNPASSKHLELPSNSENIGLGTERERKMMKVPRVASRSPNARDRAQGSSSRRKPEADIFMPAKKRRKT